MTDDLRLKDFNQFYHLLLKTLLSIPTIRFTATVYYKNHAYPHETGAEALKILFYDGFQYVAIFLTGFVLFSSNLLKNH